MKATKKMRALLISAIVILFMAAVAFGVTGAYYQTSRISPGTVVVDRGLFYTVYNVSVDENKNLISDGSILYYSNGIEASTYAAFEDISAWSNETFYIATPHIKAEEDTLPFYVRAKIEYVFYGGADGEANEITNATIIENFKTQLFNGGTELSFADNWTESDGWHYYTENGTLNTIEYGDDVYILNNSLAANNNHYSILKTGEWDALSGGPEMEYNNQTIKLEMLNLVVTIETIQAGVSDVWGGVFN